MAKTAAARPKAKKAAPKKRGAAKRELIKPKGNARYVRWDTKGRIKESDDVGKSLTRDRATKSKTKVKSSQGDKGDR